MERDLKLMNDNKKYFSNIRNPLKKRHIPKINSNSAMPYCFRLPEKKDWKPTGIKKNVIITGKSILLTKWLKSTKRSKRKRSQSTKESLNIPMLYFKGTNGGYSILNETTEKRRIKKGNLIC